MNRICYNLLGLLLMPFFLSAQNMQFTIADNDQDEDAVFQVLAGSISTTSYRELIMGFNQSNHGWIRTVSDNDLSLWTDNKKRLTIKSDGKVGIGLTDPSSRLHVNGELRVEEPFSIRDNSIGLDLFHNSEYAGGITSFIEGTFIQQNVTELNCKDNCITSLKINDSEVLVAERNGAIRIPSLSGIGLRKVSVDTNGELEAQPLGSGAEKHLMLGTSFWKTFGVRGEFGRFNLEEYYDTGNRVKNDIGLIFPPPLPCLTDCYGMKVSPSFPETRVYVKEVEVFFIDNRDNTSFRFALFKSDVDFEYTHIAYGNSGIPENSELKQSITVPVNMVFDQSDFELLHIIALSLDDNDVFLSGAKVVYEPI